MSLRLSMTAVLKWRPQKLRAAAEIEPLAPELLEAAGIDPLAEATQSSATAMDPQDLPIQQLAEQYLRQMPTVPEVQDFELDEDSGA